MFLLCFDLLLLHYIVLYLFVHAIIYANSIFIMFCFVGVCVCVVYVFVYHCVSLICVLLAFMFWLYAASFPSPRNIVLQSVW